jgi:hypothetical protein
VRTHHCQKTNGETEGRQDLAQREMRRVLRIRPFCCVSMESFKATKRAIKSNKKHSSIFVTSSHHFDQRIISQRARKILLAEAGTYSVQVGIRISLRRKWRQILVVSLVNFTYQRSLGNTFLPFSLPHTVKLNAPSSHFAR